MNRGRRKVSTKPKWSSKRDDSGVSITCSVASSLAQLNEWRRNGLLCDVTIKADNGVMISAHRNILAVNSEYFQAMFTSGLQESNTGQVDMEAFSGELLEKVIEFMYTGEIKVNIATAQDILVMTDMLQMEGLKNQCEIFMASHLDANNCLGMVEFGRKYSCTQLVEKAISLIKKRFTVIVTSDEFPTLPLEGLTEIIKMPDLHLGPSGEEVVLSGVISWVAADPPDRLEHFPQLLPYVNVSSISEKHLVKMQHHSLFTDHPHLLALLQQSRHECRTSLRVPQQEATSSLELDRVAQGLTV